LISLLEELSRVLLLELEVTAGVVVLDAGGTAEEDETCVSGVVVDDEIGRSVALETSMAPVSELAGAGESLETGSSGTTMGVVMVSEGSSPEHPQKKAETAREAAKRVLLSIGLKDKKMPA